MRILITGASGLLGINLALEAAKEHTVIGVVNANPIRSNSFNAIQADLLAPGATEYVLKQTKPDWVINCAALANLDACKAEPARARQLNTELPAILADIVARGGARLLHVSTDAVFDGQRGEYTETDSPSPISIYGKTKLEGEVGVLEVDPQAIVARTNLFGWSLSGQRSLAEFFFYNLKSETQIDGFTDVFFCPLLANHLTDIFLEMLGAGLSGIYHVVSHDCISKYEFGSRLAQKFGFNRKLIRPVSVEDAGLHAARSPNLTLRADKLTRDLGKTLPTISTGLEHFYTLYQQGYPQKLSELRTKWN